uniref:Uncharacterized protein n=1 Tax=Ciona intestinalis TaxID=7719 RepID=H2Y1V4_CIOIN
MLMQITVLRYSVIQNLNTSLIGINMEFDIA